MTEEQKRIASEFDEFMKLKNFCGGDHCSGLWNLECDAVKHHEDCELITKLKAKQFIFDQIETHDKELVEKIEKKQEEIKEMYGELDLDRSYWQVAGLQDAIEIIKNLK